jgi:hypothetical protein
MLGGSSESGDEDPEVTEDDAEETSDEDPEVTEDDAEETSDEDPDMTGDEELANAPAMDAASIQRAVIKDIAERDRIYSIVSPVIGAFNCKSMDSGQIARYAVGKLKIPCKGGQEKMAIDAYVRGLAHAQKSAKKAEAKVADSASPAGLSDNMKKYLEK